MPCIQYKSYIRCHYETFRPHSSATYLLSQMIVVGLGGSLKLPLPLQYNRQQLPKKLTSSPLKCVLTKQAHRFLSTLTTTVGDPSASASATHKLIQKFVASSPKSVSLNALSHLLSPNTSHHHLSALALPVSPN